MKRNQGFTLIELIIVIVILGILAVTAAPKFLNFGGDAKASVLKGVEASLKSSIAMVNAKAQLTGTASAQLSCFSDNKVAALTSGETACTSGVDVIYGAPAATSAALQAVAELGDFQFGTPAGGVIKIAQDAGALTATTACYVEYTAATETAPATAVARTDDCK
jgi:MSHA pilin protein MshA